MAPSSRALDWLAQAKDDLRFAKTAEREGFYAQTCFICQQIAEKALKSILLGRRARAVFTHSLYELCRALRINGHLLKAAGVLDQYYLSGRYLLIALYGRGASSSRFLGEAAGSRKCPWPRLAAQFVRRAEAHRR